MLKNVYTIFDKITGEFAPPTVEVNDSAFIRQIKVLLSDKKNMFYTAAGDYGVYKLGEYDTQTGCISPSPTPEFVCSFESIKE